MELEEGAEAPEIVAPVEDAPAENLADAPIEEEYTPQSTDELAQKMGWSPKDDWRGDPDKWKPSDQFLEATVDVNKKLYGSVKSLERQVGDMARTSAQITQTAVDKAREEAVTKRQQAFEEGDTDAFNAADKELQNIPQVEQPTPPETQDFVERNSKWWDIDKEATSYAVNRGQHYSEQGLSGARQIKAVERDLKQHFPEHFEVVPRAKPAPLNAPGARGGSAQKKGFSTLPKEVQSAALDYEKRGTCSKEEYAKIYYEESGQ